MKVLPPLAVRHPADDENVRALVLKFYELCAEYQAGNLDPTRFFVERDEIVLEMWTLQP